MKLNIAALAVSATAALHLKGPDGELLFADAERTLPVRIILQSPGSKAYGAIETRATNRALKRRADNDGKTTMPSAEERRLEQAEDYAEVTVRFENFAYEPAGDAEGTALFQAVYGDPALGFVVRQVDKFVADWGNFATGSKRS